nr:AraC family transcriptional regulator [Kocuria sp. CNJ-770]
MARARLAPPAGSLALPPRGGGAPDPGVLRDGHGRRLGRALRPRPPQHHGLPPAPQLDLPPQRVLEAVRQGTGVGFNRTGTRMRLTEACRLLRGTDLPVSDICYRVGFTNLSNINRHFRATTGTTPSRYRRLDEV